MIDLVSNFDVLFWASIVLVIFIYYEYLCKGSLAFVKNPFNVKLIKNCPTISACKFRPTPFLISAFLQTWLANRKTEDPSILEKELETVELPYGGKVALQYLRLSDNKKSDRSSSKSMTSLDTDGDAISELVSTTSKTMIVILPGITGCANDSYIIRMAKDLLNIQNGLECEVVLYLPRLNTRDFTLSNNRPINIFEDLYHAMEYLKNKHPFYNFYCVGHSYGANQLVNYLGLYHNKNIFKGAVALANPFNFVICESDIRSTIYDKGMTKVLQRCVKCSIEALKASPPSLQIDTNDILEAKTLRVFDQAFSCKVFGHNSPDDYYWDISSVRRLKDVNIPLFILNAEDDPYISKKVYIPEFQNLNPNVILMVTKKGGHLGWFSGIIPDRWYIKPVIEYLKYIKDCKESLTDA